MADLLRMEAFHQSTVEQNPSIYTQSCGLSVGITAAWTVNPAQLGIVAITDNQS